MDGSTGAVKPFWPDFTREIYGPAATKGQAKLLYKLAAEGKIRHARIGRKVCAIEGVTKADLLAQATEAAA